MIKADHILKSFRVNIIARVIILLVLCISFAVVVTNYNWFFTPLVILILIIIITINLVYYQESTNRGIVTFLTSLRQSNYTNHYFLKNKGKSFNQLEALFQDINDSFLKISLEKESHYQYLQSLNENISVGIISYLENGDIQLMNTAAKSFLKKPWIKNISDLEHIVPQLYEKILLLQQTGGSTVINHVGDASSLSIICRKFVAQDVPFHVVLIQDIKKELDAKESESWSKLVKVLTHEIMNSATPIASLSEAVSKSMKTTSIQSLNAEELHDLQVSLETIENRSKGMVNFVNAYKDYARDLEINRLEVEMSQVINNVMNLLNPLFEQYVIETRVQLTPDSIVVKVDQGLLEQVLINIIKNSIEALLGCRNSSLQISVSKDSHQVNIKILDNGPGIDNENIESIFVPFFTTKRKGTGVGLSLSKKILQLHGGDIRVNSSPSGTVFMLTLPTD